MTAVPSYRSVMHRRAVIIVLTFGMLAAACAGDPATDTTSGSSGEGDSSTPSVTLAPGGTVEGPVAPDFTLALGADGVDSFTLSEGAKPVYMVFWAEW